MGALGGLLGGGGGSSSSASASTNVSVTVNPEIKNTIINDDSRLQSMVDAIVGGNEDARAVALASAQATVEVAKAQVAQSEANTEKIAAVVQNAAITAAVGFVVLQMLKR